MNADRKAAHSRYRSRFLLAMGVYSVSLVLMVRLSRQVEDLWAKSIMVLVPIVPILYALGELLRFVSGLDELERRVQYEAVTAAAILTCMATFAWGLLELAGLPRLPVVMVLPIFCGTYGFTLWWFGRKYA